MYPNPSTQPMPQPQPVFHPAPRPPRTWLVITTVVVLLLCLVATAGQAFFQRSKAVDARADAQITQNKLDQSEVSLAKTEKARDKARNERNDAQDSYQDASDQLDTCASLAEISSHLIDSGINATTALQRYMDGDLTGALSSLDLEKGDLDKVDDVLAAAGYPDVTALAAACKGTGTSI